MPARLIRLNFLPAMFRRRLLVSALFCLLGGAAAAQSAPPPTPADGQASAVSAADPAAPSSAVATTALTGQILYQMLLAEIAGQRGQWGLASAAYLDLAQDTQDVRIARRAAEIGLHAKNYEAAVAAAKLWSDLDPADPAANVMLANLFVITQKSDDLAVTLQRNLTSAGADLGTALLQLNRVLARHADKVAVMHLVEQVTVPYLTMPEARFVRAQAAANAKDSLKAQAEIDQALILRPDWEMAALFKFQLLPVGDAALNFAASYLRQHPDARELRLSYARTLVSEKRYADAREQFKLLREALPDNPDIAYAVGILALQLDDAREAEANLKQVVELGQGRADSARFYLGQIAEFEQRYADALGWYRDVKEEDQRFTAAVRGGSILLKQERSDDFQQWFRSARTSFPADLQKLYLAESQLLRERGRYEDIQVLLDDALRAHPDDPELIYESGLNAERLGKIDLMEARFQLLIKLRPESPQGYNALGYSLADRNIRLAEAEQLIDKALKLAPEDYYILDSKGWILFRQGKADQALEFLRRAYAIKPEPEIAAHIGEVLWVSGRHAEAEAVWRAADAASPGNADLLATMKRFLP